MTTTDRHFINKPGSKMKGIINPAGKSPHARVKDHPFFGMYRDDGESVQDQMDRLRKPRHDV